MTAVSASSLQPPLVVHIIYALGTGGLENGLVNIINRCPPERYRHAIICLTRAEPFARRITAPGVDVIELNKASGHDLASYWRLWRLLRRLRPAIVHTRNMAALETQILGLVMPFCKRVHGEHGRDVHDLDGSKRKYHWLRRLLNPFVHRFIAVSQDLSRWLVHTVGIPERKVVQIYNGVDQSRFTRQPGGEAPEGLPAGFLAGKNRLVLGTVGRLATVKDQQRILLALDSLLQARPALREELRLILVGDGPEREALSALVQQLGLESLVWMPGDREDIPALLRCLDIFLLPSLGEGISNTVLEAMATGLPVIATAVGGNPELVRDGDNGLLFPVGDTRALADSIARLRDDPALRERMGQAALARIQQDFDWQRTVARYLAVYDALLRRDVTQPLQAEP